MRSLFFLYMIASRSYVYALSLFVNVRIKYAVGIKWCRGQDWNNACMHSELQIFNKLFMSFLFYSQSLPDNGRKIFFSFNFVSSFRVSEFVFKPWTHFPLQNAPKKQQNFINLVKSKTFMTGLRVFFNSFTPNSKEIFYRC